MVSIASLWLPILLSAVGVFIVSSIIHMVFRYHQNDYKRLPDEDGVMDALRGFNIPPGDYVIPCAGSMKVMNSPEYKEKINKGPIAFFTVLKTGSMAMGGSMVKWFIYSIIVGIFAAYITSRAVGPGEEYLRVFRFAGATTFIAYTVALWQFTIWYKRSLATTLKSTFDGLIYALVTAGFFGWLWPS